MSKTEKRQIKETKIIDAAEKTFNEKGFENTKMTDIATHLGISKGTVYFYFSSKENLYMAITYRAFTKVIDLYNEIIYEYKDKSALDSVIALMRGYMDFCEEFPLYSDTILHYISFVRNTAQGSLKGKVTEAMQESIYYQKIRSIQNVSGNLIIKEIQRGIDQGTIKLRGNPKMTFLTAWALVVGFTKLNDTVNTKKDTIMKIEVEMWKENILAVSRKLIKGEHQEV